jgi:hypothetical protein
MWSFHGCIICTLWSAPMLTGILKVLRCIEDALEELQLRVEGRISPSIARLYRKNPPQKLMSVTRN